MKIAFFLGSVDISGGSYVIFQHACFLEAAGHDVSIIVMYPYSANQMHWHPAIHKLRLVLIDELGEEHFDLAIATWWRTASYLHLVNADRYAYFVQSIESRFYAEQELPLRQLVDSTYDIGLPGITEATWIRDHLAVHHGSNFALARNGIRKDLYRTDGPVVAARPANKRLRVLVEGPFGVPFKNVGKTLKLVRKSGDCEIWLLTASELKWYPGVARVFSRVPIDQVPAIYRSCDVIVKLSYVEGMFGPPLEMFHCGGTAIVYDVTGHDQYIEHSRNAIVLHRDNEQGVIDALRMLARDPECLAALKLGAIKTAQAWPDWDEASSAFHQAVLAIASSPTVGRDDIRRANEAAMSRYVTDENSRLAATQAPASITQKMLQRMISLNDRIPRFARTRRIGGYFLESL